MIGTIEINGLKLFARHGVYDFERANGNTFEITAHLRYPIDKAMDSDDLSQTLNYAEAVEIIRKIMATPSDLLEHVAYRIYSELTTHYPLISGGLIKVAKLNPPIDAKMDDVAVRIEW